MAGGGQEWMAVAEGESSDGGPRRHLRSPLGCVLDSDEWLVDVPAMSQSGL